jgi:NAD(P)H-hydrate epimerase
MADVSDLVFWTAEGVPVPAVTAEQMREVDRIAVDEFGLGILQMMENAGRNLAANVMDMLSQVAGEVTVLAGGGGNGGGGLCCARHLHNRGFKVNLILDREASELRGAAADQLRILQAAGLRPVDPSQVAEAIRRADVVVDALIGYSLRGAPRGRAAELIDSCNVHAGRVLSLDVPSGLKATTGETPGLVVCPDRTLTLALPKTGLASLSGELYVADIGIPAEVYRPLGLSFAPFFRNRFWLSLRRGEDRDDKAASTGHSGPIDLVR